MSSPITVYFGREHALKRRLQKFCSIIRLAFVMLWHGEAVWVTDGEVVGMPLVMPVALRSALPVAHVRQRMPQ